MVGRKDLLSKYLNESAKESGQREVEKDKDREGEIKIKREINRASKKGRGEGGCAGREKRVS